MESSQNALKNNIKSCGLLPSCRPWQEHCTACSHPGVQFTPILMDNHIPIRAAFPERMTLPVCSFCSRVQSCWDERHWVKAGSLSASCCWEVLLLIRSGNLAQSNIYCQRVRQPYLHGAILTLFLALEYSKTPVFHCSGSFWIAKGTERVLRAWRANQEWCT